MMSGFQEKKFLLKQIDITEIIDFIEEGILLVSDGVIVDANKKAIELFKSTRDEIINNSIQEISTHYQIDGKSSAERWAKLLTQDKPRKLIWRFNRFNRRSFEAEIKINKLSSNIIIVSISDLTETTKLNNELEKAQEILRETEELKEAFIKNISHELRTPLNAILGFAQLMDFEDTSLKKQKEYIQIIKDRSKTLLRLIDDISDLDKISTQQLNIVESPTNINKLLSDIKIIINQERDRLGKHSIDIKFQHDLAYANSYFNIDPGRVEQVITHLLTNALKYTDDGFIEFGFKNGSRETIEFFVRDTGIGIPSNRLPYIFDSFTVYKENEHKESFGAGLGLAVAKGVVELMGGKIWVESEYGKGSTFYFTIKADLVKDDIPDIAISEEQRNRKDYLWKDKVILIVEDEESNLFLFTEMLEDMKVKVIHAKDGVQAVDLCKTIPQIDLVLMDLKMPKMDGYEATRKIREFNKDIPIIIQTAYAFEDENTTLKDLGCNDFISKPIEIDLMLSKMDHFLQ